MRASTIAAAVNSATGPTPFWQLDPTEWSSGQISTFNASTRANNFTTMPGGQELYSGGALGFNGVPTVVTGGSSPDGTNVVKLEVVPGSTFPGDSHCNATPGNQAGLLPTTISDTIFQFDTLRQYRMTWESWYPTNWDTWLGEPAADSTVQGPQTSAFLFSVDNAAPIGSTNGGVQITWHRTYQRFAIRSATADPAPASLADEHLQLEWTSGETAGSHPTFTSLLGRWVPYSLTIRLDPDSNNGTTGRYKFVEDGVTRVDLANVRLGSYRTDGKQCFPSLQLYCGMFRMARATAGGAGSDFPAHAVHYFARRFRLFVE